MSGEARASYDAGDRPEAMTLGELTDAAGVSVRTVRYYIAEGLLPPPEGSGPASAYARGHLDRLRLIQRLKAAYLPLKEIRRRLAGLDDAAVRALLDAEEGGMQAATELPYDASLADAREYLALLESRGRYRTEPMPLAMADAAMAPPAAPEPRGARVHERSASLREELPPAAAPAAGEEGEQRMRRHIRLGDEAELVISDQVYARHRDRIDWLVRWARKVFD
ncbi:MAG: MerR family transcriptional regulator [Thermomicrobiales bacterium]|nr:MerR family transcriptional regulator [Thermomicrobiales bacterium]